MRIIFCLETVIICITASLIVGCESSSNVPAAGAVGTAKTGPAMPPPPPPSTGVASDDSSNADESRRVQDEYRRLLDAPEAGDWATFFQLTHPKVIESAGGQEELKKNTLILPADVKSELTFPSPPVFLKGTQHQFVVIPWKLVMTRNGKTAEASGAELGIRQIGQLNWAYMEGSNQDRTELNASFPDFPANYQFPASTRKPFTAN
jgi:hypothetical protein